MAFLAIREREKWNRKIKKRAVREAKIVRAGTRTIYFFTSHNLCAVAHMELLFTLEGIDELKSY